MFFYGEIDKLWYIHKMKYCSAIKSNKWLKHIKICMNLKDTTDEWKKPVTKDSTLHDSI